MQWQSIETAPRDGTRILVFCKDHIYIAYWNINACVWNDCDIRQCWTVYDVDDFYYSIHLTNPTPTYWMPLPEPPKE